MRLLVLSTHRTYSVSVRLLASIGASLSTRGEEVTFVCCRNSDTEREVARTFPTLTLRSLNGGLAARRIASLRRIVTELRPDALLVHTERDALAAALTIGRTGGVVRRLSIGQRLESSWRVRLTTSRTRFLAMGDEVGESAHLDKHVRTAVSWPALGLARDDRATADSADNPFRSGPSAPPPVIAIVAGDASNPAQHAAGAAALRTASRIVSRHPELRVTLLGHASGLQALRVHAGAVGLADRLDVMPVESLLSPGPFTAAALWATGTGDDAAVGIVAAMMRRIPVIVPRGFDTEALVAPRITGFIADDSDLAGSVASLAHLMADPADHQAMGAAAAARADRLHGWDAMITRTLSVLARVAA